MHRRSKDNKPKFGSHTKLALSYANKVNRPWATDRQQKHDPANQLCLAFPAALWRINFRIQLSLLRSSPLARWGSGKSPERREAYEQTHSDTWPKTRRPGRVLRTRPARHLEYIWLKLSESCRQKWPTSAAAYRTSGVLAWVLTFWTFGGTKMWQNSRRKVNGQVIFRKFQSRIEDHVLR